MCGKIVVSWYGLHATAEVGHMTYHPAMHTHRVLVYVHTQVSSMEGGGGVPNVHTHGVLHTRF